MNRRYDVRYRTSEGYIGNLVVSAPSLPQALAAALQREHQIAKATWLRIEEVH